MRNIYGDQTDAQGRPSGEPDYDASPIDGRTAEEADPMFAKVRVTYTVEVRVSREEARALDTLDDLTEVGVIHRALDQIRENPGRDREEEVVDLYEGGQL